VLFNADRLQKCEHSPILVVEGWLDAIYLWPHAVAVLGSPSHKHLELLAQAKDDVVFVLDGDAWVKGQASAMTLRLNGKKAASVRLPPTLDPDDLPAQVVYDLALKSLQEL
jgi:DNA primase